MEADQARRGRGYTLVEVVIVVGLLGLVMLVVAGVFSVVVRTAPTTEARADDARSLLGLSQWLPADVGSTPPGSIDISVGGRRATSGCAGSAQTDLGEDLLFLSWSGVAEGASHTFRVIYRWQPQGDGAVIKRYSCRDGGPAQVNTLSSTLTLINGSIPVSIVPVGNYGIEFTVTVRDPATNQIRELLVLDALTRNSPTAMQPVGTVGPTTTTSSTTTTTTTTAAPTTTTTTTAPPPGPTTTTSSTSTTTTTTTTLPCAVSSAAAAPQPVERNTNGNNEATLTSVVTVTIATTGNCPPLFVRYYPRAWSNSAGQVHTTPFLGSGSVQLPTQTLWRPNTSPGHLLEIVTAVNGSALNSTRLVVQ